MNVMRIFALTLVLITVSFYQLCGQTFSSSPSLALPGAETSYADITVSGLGSIMDASFGLENVCIDITHPNTNELTIWIVAPDGTQILLTEKNGGSGDNYTNTCFDGNSMNPQISSGTPPFTGNFQPEQSLGLLNTGIINADGTWKLKVLDDFFFNNGTLNSISLTFGNNPAVVPSSPNDACANAIQLNLNNDFSCNIINAGTIANATPSGEIDNCNFTGLTFDDDVWFLFTAISTIQEFEISNVIGSSTELIYQVLGGACGTLTQLFCYENPDNNFTVSNLTIDADYYLRIASKTSTTGQNISFDICVKEGVPPPPLNDECTGAISLPNEGGCNAVSASVSGATHSADSESCSGDGGFSNDIWFSFVATQVNHEINVFNVSGTSTDLDFQLNQGTCGSLNQVKCFFDPDPGETVIFAANNLNIGTTYFLRIATFSSAPQNTRFDICLSTPATPPVNDECSNAIALICDYISATLSGATASSQVSNCDISYEDFFDDDVWFSFEANSTSQDIVIANISGSTDDLVFEIFTGLCNSLIPFACQDDPNDIFTIDTFDIGQTYYLRVASFNDLTENTTFDIKIKSNNLMVMNNQNSGAGSLREAVANACQSDTIRFDSGLIGETILLDFPTLTIDKNLVLHSDVNNNIILGNANPDNTNVLVSIQDNLFVKNLKLNGTSAAAMKIEIINGGLLKIY